MHRGPDEEIQHFLDLDAYPLPLQGKGERLTVYRWIDGEEPYVFGKFDNRGQREDHDKGLIDRDFEQFWERQILQYIDRVKQALGGARRCREDGDHVSAEHLEKRALQAMLKSMMTAKGCAESMVRVFGTPPLPGVTSGDVFYWDGWTIDEGDEDADTDAGSDRVVPDGRP